MNMLTRFFTFLCMLLSGIILWAQPENDDCENAIELCDKILLSGTTIGATTEECFNTNPNGCADDNGGNGLCYVPAATVWYKFTTNSTGGNVMVDFTNLNINPDPTMGRKLEAVIIQSDVPCEGGNYSYVSLCFNNGLADFSMTNTSVLTPNTTYYIQVNGSGVGPNVTQPAQIDFDITISGSAVQVQPVSVSISAENTDLCQYDQVPVDFEITNCLGTPKTEWFFNGSLSGSDPVFQTSSLTESGYLYLQVSCGTEGCPNITNSDSILFNITQIEADAGEDKLIESNGAVMIEGSGVGIASWTPTDNLINSNTFTPTSSAEITTQYTLTVTNGDCELSDQMTVRLKDPIDIMTAFTPNNDGRNDFWDIKFLEQYPNNQVIVYDRSGQVVYKTVGYNNGSTAWDGTYKGRPVPPSTYFYFVDLRDGSKNSVFRGPVTIIR